MKVKTSELAGAALDWAVGRATSQDVMIGASGRLYIVQGHTPVEWSPSTNWAQGGQIIESANITVIRANDDYEKDAQGSTTLKRVPVWFAECDRWVGHSLCTSYEGEYMEPTFMIGEGGGYYGPTPLVAAMRAYVALKLGNEIEIPEELCQPS